MIKGLINREALASTILSKKEKTYIKPSEFIVANWGIKGRCDFEDLDQGFIHKSVLEDYKLQLKEEITKMKYRFSYELPDSVEKERNIIVNDTCNEILKLLEEK